MKKETPILFSSMMALAVVAQNKTMTRRAVKGPTAEWLSDDTKFTPEFVASPENDLCPYGKVGDILWVRETWQPNLYTCVEDGEFMVTFQADGKQVYFYPDKCANRLDDMTSAELKKAGIEIDGDGKLSGEHVFKNRPGIHLFKELSRIWLEITSVTVERVQDASVEDILAEGVRYPVNDGRPVFQLGKDNSALSFLPDGCLQKGAEPLTEEQILKAHWAELWCDINGRESWDANSWVWVISFKVLSTDGKPEIL